MERDSLNNTLAVLANDNARPATAVDWTITDVSTPTPLPVDPDTGSDTLVIVGENILYSPEPGFVGTKTFTYDVSDGLGGTGSATVTVKVGDLPVCEDRFVAISGSTDNEFDVLANDNIRPDVASGNADPNDDFTLDSVGTPDQGGSAAISNGLVLYTPDPGYAGSYPYEETFTYNVIDDSDLLVTGTAIVTVYEEGDDRDTATLFVTVTGVNDAPIIDTSAAVKAMITDKEFADPFMDVRYHRGGRARTADD